MNLPKIPDDQPTLRDIAYRFGTVSADLDDLAVDGSRHSIAETLAYAELAVADLRKIAEATS
jgi:hypothetical protein